jgi:hypothetical protein
VRLAVLAIALVGLALPAAMPAVTEHAGGWPLAARMALAVGLIAPLAFFMGQMLPVALERLPGPAVPWAWAVNGCASVTGAVLATLIAVGLGFGACVLGALALYGVAAATLPVADAVRPA